MPGGLLTTELVRAYQKYFRAKDSPNVPPEILPVVMMDDNSRGPYAPYLSWYCGFQSPQLAGNYSYCWICNEDGPAGAIAPTAGGKSAVIVDDVFARADQAADDFMIVVQMKGLIVGGTKTCVQAANNEYEFGGSTAPSRICNVSVQALQSAPSLFNPTHRWPSKLNLGEVARIKGPFYLPPNGLLLVTPATQNNGLTVFFRGRYYPPS